MKNILYYFQSSEELSAILFKIMSTSDEIQKKIYKIENGDEIRRLYKMRRGKLCSLNVRNPMNPNLFLYKELFPDSAKSLDEKHKKSMERLSFLERQLNELRQKKKHLLENNCHHLNRKIEACSGAWKGEDALAEKRRLQKLLNEARSKKAKNGVKQARKNGTLPLKTREKTKVCSYCAPVHQQDANVKNRKDKSKGKRKGKGCKDKSCMYHEKR